MLLCILAVSTVSKFFDVFTLNWGNVWLARASLQGKNAYFDIAQQILDRLENSLLAKSAYKSLATTHLLRGNASQALQYALQAVQLAPQDLWAADLAGQAYWAGGDGEKARHFWQKNDTLKPRLERLDAQGWQSLRQGDDKKALIYFEQEIKLDPTWPWGYWAISSYYWNAQQTDLARPYLEKAAVLLHKDSPEQLLISGRLSILDKDYAAAEKQFCQAFALSSQKWFFESCLWSLWRRGDWEKGLAAMEKMHSTEPILAYAAAENWGERLFAAQKYAQAADFYRFACSQSDPDSHACQQLNTLKKRFLE